MTEAQIKELFFQSLQCGTGKAYHILKQYPNINFSKLILKAGTKNFAYDPQCEGSRAWYIYTLAKQSQQYINIRNTFINRLKAKKQNYYGIVQLFDLALLFYKNDGYKPAKKAILSRFEKNVLPNYEFCGIHQIIEMDGITGLFKMAEVLGKCIEKNEDWYEDSFWVDSFQENNPHIDIYQELKNQALTNSFIKVYLDHIVQNRLKKASIERKRPLKYNYNYIKSKIDNFEKYYLFPLDLKKISNQDLEKLAKEFLLEKNIKKQELYLYVFRDRKFTFNNQFIIDILDKKEPKGSRLHELACEALKFFKSPQIRLFALDKLKTKEKPSIYLPLLIKNYKKGDDKLLVDIINLSDDFEHIHSLIENIINIYTHNPIKESKTPLELMYRKTNCGIHREAVIELLYKNRVLSKEIIHELPFDSEEQIRMFYEDITKKAPTEL